MYSRKPYLAEQSDSLSEGKLPNLGAELELPKCSGEAVQERFHRSMWSAMLASRLSSSEPSWSSSTVGSQTAVVTEESVVKPDKAHMVFDSSDDSAQAGADLEHPAATGSTGGAHDDSWYKGRTEGPVWSKGAELHNLGQCTPCAHYYRKHCCSNGRECSFCHTCLPSEVQKRRRQRRRQAKQRAALAECQGDEAAASVAWPKETEQTKFAL